MGIGQVRQEGGKDVKTGTHSSSSWGCGWGIWDRNGWNAQEKITNGKKVGFIMILFGEDIN
eukprot:10960240-Ditylum_brightwellii.AAC.1